MRAPPRLAAASVLCAATLCACLDGGDRVLSVDANGAFHTQVYLDQDGNRLFDSRVDTPLKGIRLLLYNGVSATVATATTDEQGMGRMGGVPVGRYRVVIDSVRLGDTIQVVQLDSAQISVLARDTVRSLALLGYPLAPLAKARQLGAGKLITIEGTVLHPIGAFGDSTTHLSDTSGFLRVSRITSRAPVSASDSIRLTGRLGIRDGQPTLLDPSIRILGVGSLPKPRLITSAEIAGADQGRLDAALVRLSESSLIDVTRFSSGDLHLRVDDGSGAGEVVLDQDLRIVTDLPLVPGVSVTISGVLVPRVGKGWQLMPRSGSDLVVSVPTRSIADARRLTGGRPVTVEGVALNGWRTFGNATLHLADHSGALRALQVRSSFIVAGDSVRITGTMQLRDGQPVLSEGIPTYLGRSRLPTPITLSVAAAAGASGGTLDAALVEVASAIVRSQRTVEGQPALVVKAAAGADSLLVVVDRDTGIGTARFVAGTTLRLIGLLTPGAGGGPWVLKPRTVDDIVVQ